MTEYILPFIQYCREDKSEYKKASEAGFKDLDDDFLIGKSGGILMNISFYFVNTYLFTEVAKFFEDNGVYTKHPKGSAAYKEFWKRETRRRREGMIAPCKLLPDGTVVNLRITGDHYNHLNYTRMQITPDEETKEDLRKLGILKSGKIEGFPRFYDGDYWTFKMDEFAQLNDKNEVNSKARRKGFSYKRGGSAANRLNGISKSCVVFAAYLDKYLTDPGATTQMIKANLDWYENHTYWKRGYISEDITALELGYKKRKEGHKKYGWLSKCLSVTLYNNPSAAVGKDAQEIDFEEAGVCPNLGKALDVTLSAVEAGDITTGIIRIYGTGGTRDANWKDFSNVFYNTAIINALKFENIWDDNMRHSTCGFFFPQVWAYEPYIDEHGNSLLDQAWIRHCERYEVAKKELGPEEFIIWKGQRANKPSEAFVSSRENIFNRPELQEHLNRIRIDKDIRFHRDGMLIRTSSGIKFKTNVQLELENIKTHPYIDSYPIKKGYDEVGCIREWYPPIYIQHDDIESIPDNLYVISSDSVGVEKDPNGKITKKSYCSYKVWMNPNNITPLKGDIIVATYFGRNSSLERDDEILLMLCEYYNAKVLPEIDRGQVVQDFRKWKKLNRIMSEPTYSWDKSMEIKEGRMYGMSIAGGRANVKKLHGLSYLADWIFNRRGVDENGNEILNLHYIYDIPFLEELSNFDEIGNFDRISDAIIGMYAMKELVYRKTKPKDKSIKKDSIFNRQWFK